MVIKMVTSKDLTEELSCKSLTDHYLYFQKKQKLLLRCINTFQGTSQVDNDGVLMEDDQPGCHIHDYFFKFYFSN